MKKLFLTSGIIACMACPALAETGFTTTEINGGTPVYDTNNQQTGISIAGGCVEPKLGVYSGAVTLRAKWEAIYNTILFDSNLDTDGLTTNGDGVDASPAQIYAASGHLWKTLSGGNLSDQLDEGDTPFDSGTPSGDTVTYVIKYNDTTGSTVSSRDTEVTGRRRPLQGFYYNNTQMVDENGLLTAAGAAANSNQTWTASWGSATPSIGTAPTRDGYNFVRWDLDTDDTVETPGAISENTDVYAIWAANTYTINYSCGTGTGVHGSPATVAGSGTATFDSPYTWLGNDDATNCGKAGYHFTGWDCSNGVTASVTQTTDGNDDPISGSYVGDTVSVSGSPWTTLANNTTISCTAHYEANEIALTWDVDGTQSSGSCTYDSGITLPAAPANKNGFEFIGWEIVPLSGVEDQNLYNGE